MAKWIKRVLLCLAWLVVWIVLYWGLLGELLAAQDRVWREQSVNQVMAGDKTAGGRWVRGHTAVFTIFSNAGWLVLFGGGALIFYWTRSKVPPVVSPARLDRGC